MKRIFVALLLSLFGLIASAQDKLIHNFFKEVNPATIVSAGTNSIQAKHSLVVEIDTKQLYEELESVPHRDGLRTGSPIQIELPQPDGTTKRYQVMENSTMDPELGAKYPQIKTYDAYGINNTSELVKFDLTPQGFHAMIMKPGASPIFIDPLKRNNTQYYMVYSKQDFMTSKTMKCGVVSQNNPLTNPNQFNHFANFNTCELKKYRLAMAATAQYTIFQGGTVADALAAQVTTMNRVNGIYETEMAITMVFIPNNNLIIYTNINNQPYTSGNPDLEINQNQTNIDAVIGPNNYDIGHVVDAAGSGLAQLRSVCVSGEKAMGVTGQPSPIGDPFDVDYVAHEMGHQFGANHVQNNNCQRNNPTAVEPGSGSTIMSYAGICAPNVQAHADAYFNGISLQEMGNFVTTPTHTCPIRTPIPAAPVINSTNGFSTVPANTPFALTAIATKTGGSETLTYDWEQMNNEISQQPPTSTARGGPNFRSFSPQISGTRYFPNLTSLANNGPFTWEVIPSVSRIMNFRVSVRRNTPGGSCNAYTNIAIQTDTRAGPFIVTSPDSNNISWEGITSQAVSWNTANTDRPPINAELVDILLSIDGGQSFPYTLISGVYNSGNHQICVPNIDTTTARIMVKAANGTFFNVTHNNFTITAVTPIAPALTAADRDGMETSQAFIEYAGCIPVSQDRYTVNGLPGATIRFDINNSRFIIGNITTPRRVVISITATDQNNISRTSNPITIPSIL